MPNWVFNNLSVTGDIADLETFKEEIAKPYTTNHWDFVRDEEGTAQRVQREALHESPLSFWNAIAPDDLDAYFGKPEKPKADRTSNEIWQDILEGSRTGMDWYNWNVRYWGCKWDACNVTMWEEPNELRYDFETPWSIPEPAMIAMSAKYPNLTFDLHSEEEQGWGADIVFKAGEANVMEEWDIPVSHEDYVMLGRECMACVSGLNTDDMDEWYDDCPRPDLTDIPENGNVVV